MNLPRIVKYGMRGVDVEGHGAALHRYVGTGQLPKYRQQRERVKQTFGLAKQTLAKQAARKAGLPAYGVVGPRLFDAMWEAGAYNALARDDGTQAHELLRRYVAQQQIEQNPRLRAVLAGKRRHERRDSIAYSQARPMLYVEPPGVERYLDCSAFVTACYREAGLPDPNGWRYEGWGFTGSLWTHGRAISIAELQPADLIFYGIPWRAGSSAHVVMYRGGGRAYGHGQSAGPLEHSIFYRPIVGCRSYL